MSNVKRQFPAGAPPSRPPPSLPGSGSTHRNMPVPKRPPPSAPQTSKPPPPAVPQTPKPLSSSAPPRTLPPCSPGSKSSITVSPQVMGGAPLPTQTNADNIQKKSTIELIKTLNASEGQMKLMEKFLGSLSSAIKSQLDKAAAYNKEALELGKVVQSFSIEFINGDSNPHLTELGHCTVAVSNLIQGVHGAFYQDLQKGLQTSLESISKMQVSFHRYKKLMHDLKDAKGRVDDMNEKIQNAQKKGKIDLGKLSEYQQERDACADKCRKLAEDGTLMYESLSREFTSTCFEEFSNYIQGYETYFSEGNTFASQTGMKKDSWRAIATAVKEEREKKVSQLSGVEKISMSNALLQLLANTEQQYIAKLKIVSQTFPGSIMKDGALLNEISKEEINTIFGIYRVLFEHHQELLQQLASTQSAGATFNESGLNKLFSTYRMFISAFRAAEETLFNCRKRSRVFAKKIKSLEADIGGAELTEMMCLPLLRIGEYTAALESIATQSNPPLPPAEAREVRMAAKGMEELGAALSREECGYRVRCVLRSIHGCPEHLTAGKGGRKLLNQATVTTSQGQGEAFLFNDILLVTRRAMGLNIMSTFGKKKYNYVNSFKLRNIEIKGIKDDTVPGIRNGIEITDISSGGGSSLDGSIGGGGGGGIGNSGSGGMSMSMSGSSSNSGSSGGAGAAGSTGPSVLYLGFESDESRRNIVDKIYALRTELEASRVFGVPLETLMASFNERGREVPHILEDTIQNLNSRGLGHEGLFRISGGKRELEEIRDSLDSGCPVNFSEYTVHTVAGSLKLWLRSLPEPLLTSALSDEFSSATKGRSPADALRKVESLISRLPRANRACLTRLILFLARVAENSAENMMKSSNLSIVFSPPLLQGAKQDSSPDATMFSFANASYDIVMFMIDHSKELFAGNITKSLPEPRRFAPVTHSPGQVPEIDIADDFDDSDGSGGMGTGDGGVLGDGSGLSGDGSEITLSMRDIVKQGPLQKAREKWGSVSYELRWIIVKKGWLYNFHSQKDKKGDIYNLSNAGVREVKGKPSSFVLSLPASGEEINFTARNADDLASWLIAINTCII